MPRRVRNRYRRQFLLVVAAILLLFLSAPSCAPMIDPENIQDQTTTPAERLQAGETIAQSFVAHQNGLTAIDLVVARFPEQSASDLLLRLRASDADTPILATGRIPATTAHNERVRFSFPPLSDSEGKTYILEIFSHSITPNALSVWATTEPVYPDGQRFHNGATVPGALSFRTFYQYDAHAFVADVLALRQETVTPALVTLVLLILPGLALTTLAPGSVQRDLAERLGVAVGASVAFWPVVLWCATLVQAPMNGAMAVIVVLVIVTGSCVLPLYRLFLKRRVQSKRACQPIEPGSEPNSGESGSAAPVQARATAKSHASGAVVAGVFAVGLIALALRLIVIRDLVWPLWVDSVHHTLIAQEIASLGVVPTTYGPFVPDQPFTYHFGFHTLVAVVHWVTDAEIPWLVLIVGQILSGLIVFPVYLLANRFCQSPWAGLAAGACVGCLSTMPAYYVSWGRYPQLAGLIVLPVAYLALMWASGNPLPLGTSVHPSAVTTDNHHQSSVVSRAGKVVKRLLLPRGATPIVLAAFLAAGLVLTHPRVALLYGALVFAGLLVASAQLLRQSRPNPFRWRILARPWLGAGATALASAIVLWPWLTRLVTAPLGAHLIGGIPAPPAFFAPPIYGRYDTLLAVLAAIGIVVGLWRRRLATITLVLWLAIVWLLANPQALGIPINLLLSNSSVEIALFLPMSLAIGIAAALCAALLERTGRPGAPWAVAGAFVTVTLLASGNMLDVVNPGTFLYTRSDIAALTWMRENLPGDARVLINAAHWQANIYAGTDGGYWIPVIARRSATTPPLLYDGATTDAARAIHTVSAAVEAWAGDRESLDDLIRDQHVTHIYVGARRGPLRPDRLVQHGFPLVYSNGRSWLFVVSDAVAAKARSD